MNASELAARKLPREKAAEAALEAIEARIVTWTNDLDPEMSKAIIEGRGPVSVSRCLGALQTASFALSYVKEMAKQHFEVHAPFDLLTYQNERFAVEAAGERRRKAGALRAKAADLRTALEQIEAEAAELEAVDEANAR